MPSVLYGAFPSGVALPPGPNSRYIGPLALDQPPLCMVREIIPPSVRSILAPSISDRRRTTRVKEDAGPFDIEVRGFWRDDPTGAPRFRDFNAALLNQQQVAFNMGDGQEYRVVDVLDVLPTRLDAVQHDWPGQRAEAWSWVARVRSYEPYARVRNPPMSAPLVLATANGATTTAFAVPYPGTAPGEPTWQFKLVVQAGVTVSALALQNTLTGELCTVSGLGLTNGTYYVLLDASGADGGLTPRTPNNNGYGLLAVPTTGYGACWSTGAVATDLDFSGNIPTLRETRGTMQVNASSSNPMIATVTATAALTAASLCWLAPATYIRTG